MSGALRSLAPRIQTVVVALVDAFILSRNGDYRSLGVMFSNSENRMCQISYEGREDITDYQFFNCKELQTVVLDDRQVERIGAYAFANCSELKSVTLGEKTRRIGPFAFAW